MAARHAPSTPDSEQTAQRLLECVRSLVEELQPGRTGLAVELDSILDRELGIDSLGRVELFARIETEFDLVLPEVLFANAETPRDLLRAAIGSEGKSGTAVIPSPVIAPADSDIVPLPREATTLCEVLDFHAAQHPDRIHVLFHSDNGTGLTLTYGGLQEGARRVAAGLRVRGLNPGEPVAIMLPTSDAYMIAFFGVLMAGGVTAPLYPPGRPAQLEEHLTRHALIVANSRARFMITVEEAKQFTWLLKARVETLEAVLSVEELESEPGDWSPLDISPADTALLQYTSGSTGNPKGVVLSHANLLANIRVMGEALEAGPKDVCVSWLPLYHDMGLIGSWLGSLYFATRLVIMSPLAFLARPERWLRAISDNHATISGGPNFGFELCLRRLDPEKLAGLDLSSWRCAFNGAEMVSPHTIQAFCQHFSGLGFDERAMMPVYGLAESSVGLAFPPLDRGPVIDAVDRNLFTKRGKAKVTDNENALKFVSSGRPLSKHQIRIVDAAGRDLPDRHEGRLQFRGPSVTSGYFRNVEQTSRLFAGDWLESGDLAYMADGEVYITGRTKDLIIRGGRNIYPTEVEEAIGRLEGIQAGNVAVFGSPDPDTGTERLIVLAESRKREDADREGLRASIIGLVTDLTGVPPDDVVLAPPRTVPKTSSGKIRRAASREIYELGRVGAPSRAVWWQVVRIAASGIKPELRRLGSALGGYIYGGYVLAIAGVLAPPLWLGIVLGPSRPLRLGLVRGVIRLFCLAARIQVTLRGLENLPPGDRTQIFVSNHMSYLDSVLLTAFLPRKFQFIAKSELKDSWLTRLPLDRLGVAYVERFDRQQSLEDAERITSSLSGGAAPFFFAEGTLTRDAGLLPFQMGAFVAAATAEALIVPVTIRGTRMVLRDKTWLPRHGAVSITISPPVQPEKSEGSDIWAEAVRLRDAVRAEILRQCAEPDLAGERAELFSVETE
ncbi:MAG: AMP-binding protein [Alphaproteobacteria bacterium]|nr:AMP-binding protein [Alphaproteobacteria bacterium]